MLCLFISFLPAVGGSCGRRFVRGPPSNTLNQTCPAQPRRTSLWSTRTCGAKLSINATCIAPAGNCFFKVSAPVAPIHLFRRACVLKNVGPYVGWIVCLLVRVLVRPLARVFVRWCVCWSVRSAKTGCGLSWERPVRSRTHPFRLCMRNVTQCRGCAVVRTMLVMVVDWFAPGKARDLSSVINR